MKELDYLVDNEDSYTESANTDRRLLTDKWWLCIFLHSADFFITFAVTLAQ